ncbi:MAG: glucose-6-phosphate isomerase, partial [Casimicrobiaceae bacterium]
MIAASVAPTTRPAWKALLAHHQAIRDVHLRALFADDPVRGDRMCIEAAGILLDYSKNRATGVTLALLILLAVVSGMLTHIDAMFSCENINITEDRAVLL